MQPVQGGHRHDCARQALLGQTRVAAWRLSPTFIPYPLYPFIARLSQLLFLPWHKRRSCALQVADAYGSALKLPLIGTFANRKTFLIDPKGQVILYIFWNVYVERIWISLFVGHPQPGCVVLEPTLIFFNSNISPADFFRKLTFLTVS